MEQLSSQSGTLIREKGKVGRPRIHRILPFQHYQGSIEGKRQRCKNRGCRGWLKRNDKIVCSQKCANTMKKNLLDQIKLIEKDELNYVRTS